MTGRDRKMVEKKKPSRAAINYRYETASLISWCLQEMLTKMVEYRIMIYG
jgi:hypothetical protein